MSGQSATSGSRSAAGTVDLGVLTTVLPAGLIEEVIDQAGCREQRRRRLPAHTVMLFVLGMCLFNAADRFGPPGYRAVWKSLTGRARGASRVSCSALTQARQRLGTKPMRMLFDRVRGPVAASPQSWSHAFGLRLVAWDATTVSVADTADNAAAFGYQGVSTTSTTPPGPGSAVGANPLVRLMTLVECGTHALIDVEFDGVAQASEIVLARRLLASLQPGMLLLADRNFLSHNLWAQAAASGADLLWRAKSNIYLVPTRHLPDGSYLAVIPTPEETRRLGRLRARQHRHELPREGAPVRVVEFTVTITTDHGQRTETYRLVTTLLDHTRAPADHLAALYHQRWESETSNSHLKPRLIGPDVTLRSRTPDGIHQELYGFLTIYQALTTLRLAAATTAHLDPDHISFLITIRAVRSDITSHSTHTPTRRQRLLITELIHHQLAPRRARSSPRQRVPRTGKYTNKRRDQPRPTSQAHYELKIKMLN